MSDSHLFVIHGDLAKVHADGYLIPSDGQLRFGADWHDVLRGQPEPKYQPAQASKGRRLNWGVVETRAPDDTPDRSLMLVTDIASTKESIPWLTSGLEIALSEADWYWRDNPSTRRERPLLAMPLIGCRRGGFHGVQGAVVRELLTTLHERVPNLRFDVVLVCYNRAQYAAVQSTRKEAGLCNPKLPDSFKRPVSDLATFASRGSLGVLFGAGVSMPLGIPNWKGLLGRLSEGTTIEQLGDLSGLDPMDAASLVLSAMPKARGSGTAEKQFRDRLSRCVQVSQYSLAHGLLASLRPTVAVTTNYDRGYELALSHVLGPPGPAVMPWGHPEGAAAPRVLKLHGDVEFGSVVLSRKDFVVMHATRRPLTALLQEQMLAHHLLAVGTSMSDSTLVSAIAEASTLLRSIRTKKRTLGTLVMTQHDPARAKLLRESMDVLVADEPPTEGGESLTAPAAARISDMLLDAVGLMSMRELNYLADPKFLDLIKDKPGRLVTVADRARDLRNAVEATGQIGQPRWAQILAALEGLGAGKPDSP